MTFKVANNAVGVLAGSIDDVDTTLALDTGQGAKFPEIDPGEWFPITVVKVSNPAHMEIMRVTDRTGDAFTVERAQEGTSALSFQAGDVVELRFTAGLIQEFQSDVDGRISGKLDALGGVAGGLCYSIVTPEPVGGVATCDLSDQQVFNIDASSPIDVTFTNFPAGVSMGIILNITGNAAVTITNMALRWDEGAAPELGASWTQLAFLWDGTHLTGSLRASG